ncbi:hypothetical protein ERO13_A09G133200v2 [Gossypium hirsutum]|nr:hypothetical protein ERO13_A09G133200v2 [Gossypium hirsutum]
MEMIQYNRFIETLVLLSCCLVVPLTVANDVRYCDNAKYDVKVHGVIQSLGEACDLIICNNRCSNIWGTLVIEFSYFGWHIYGFILSDYEDVRCKQA